MILPDQINLAEVAYFMHQVDEELEIQSRIVRARALDAGFYPEALATKTADYLVGGNANDIEGINLISIVLRTVVRRLDIQSITSIDETFQTWINNVWDANAMDSKQAVVHRGAERDGGYFIIVDYDRHAPRPWDETTGLPVFYLHQRYTSSEATWNGETGDNQGCKAHYRNNDPNQPLDMVSHRWIETTWVDGEPKSKQRMTLFIAAQLETPARIEKYVLNGDDWVATQDKYLDDDGNVQTEEWPIWWTDDHTEFGRSLRLPVVHFPNEELEPIAQRLAGLQNGMDHAWSSLIAAITISAHQIFTAFGFWPTTDGKPPADDGSNLVTIQARSIIGNGNVSPKDASFNALPAGNISAIVDAMDKIAIYVSFVAGLPISNFVVSKSVASSSTLRQGGADLIAHVHELTRLFGHSWTDVFEIARMLEELYGDTKLPSAKAEAVWSPPETTNPEAINSEAIAKDKTGIPWQTIAETVWGYTQEQIEIMEQLSAAPAENTGTAK